MQTLFNARYVMTPNAYAHPKNAMIRVAASRNFRRDTFVVNEGAMSFDVILIRRYSSELA